MQGIVSQGKEFVIGVVKSHPDLKQGDDIIQFRFLKDRLMVL